ncbi:MAG TPA: ABC transporter ATP-binding protein [Myxococcota bacterium]|nr:ABC transporter ATP-binding protein [Myxococcota bacterium]
MRIEARGVTKRYGRVAALDGVSFEVAPRSRVALVGPNGSGKSTLNRVLMGLVACEGYVRLDGRCPLRERHALARATAYVPQTAPQLAAPVDEVVRAIARVRGLEPKSVASVAAELDLDLASVARRPFRSLSGGTKQKLLIALALSARASLLILDEPTGSLDAHARERFFARFEALAPEVTLVLCSHRLDEIRPLVDHVLLLDDGRVGYDGPAAAFLERCALATIDVWADGEEAAAWLSSRGFRRGAGGSFRRTVDHAEKMKLVSELLETLGPRVRNLSARDLEGVDLGGAMPGADGAARPARG